MNSNKISPIRPLFKREGGRWGGVWWGFNEVRKEDPSVTVTHIPLCIAATTTATTTSTASAGATSSTTDTAGSIVDRERSAV